MVRPTRPVSELGDTFRLPVVGEPDRAAMTYGWRWTTNATLTEARAVGAGGDRSRSSSGRRRWQTARFQIVGNGGRAERRSWRCRWDAGDGRCSTYG
jgi:hypothetical protein